MPVSDVLRLNHIGFAFAAAFFGAGFLGGIVGLGTEPSSLKVPWPGHGVNRSASGSHFLPEDLDVAQSANRPVRPDR